MKLNDLVGSGDKVGLFTLPFIVIGIGLNILFPHWFSVGGPAPLLQVISIILLIPGVVIWIWTVYLILTVVPKKQLITTGPYVLTRHPLYAGVALLVIPWVGFLLNTWIGVVIGGALYVASRLFAPDEEKLLAKTFGAYWEEYKAKVLLPWL
jgi:protein-S-isoprenylcysteine O-methyltransferase Ste14